MNPRTFPYQRFMRVILPACRHSRAGHRYNAPPTAPRRPMATTLLEAHLPGLELLHRGKVRDVYALPPGSGPEALGPLMLMVATDRLSAFDVVLPDPRQGRDALPGLEALVRPHRAPGAQPPHRHRPRVRIARRRGSGTLPPALGGHPSPEAGAGGGHRPWLPDRQRL